MQVLSTTVAPRPRRRSKLEAKLDLRFIHQLGKGVHVGKYIVKAPNGRDAQGRLEYKRFGPFAEVERAVKARDEHLARQIEQRIESLPVGRQARAMTLAEWFEHWITNVVPGLTGLSTSTKYRSLFERHILPSLGHIALVDLTTTRIQAWKTELAKGVGAPTVNNSLKRLKTCLYAAALDPKTTGISDSPAAGKRVVKLREAKRKVYSGRLSDMAQLMDAAGDTYMAPLVRVAIDSGLRCSELAGLHWADVEWDARQLRLRWHTVTSGSGDAQQTALVPGTKSSSGEDATVPLSQGALDALRLVRERLIEHKLAASSWKAGQSSGVFYAANSQAAQGAAYVVPSNPVAEEALVFPQPDGMPYRTTALSGWFARICAKAGIDKTFHGMRHDCGSFMLAQGVPLTVVSKHLRHANTAITAEIYAHMLPDDSRLGADTFDRLWASLGAQAQAV